MKEEIILKKFSERFFKLVKESDMSIDSLAQKIGIKSKSTIYRYMNGEMAPKLTTVKYLAEIFNVNPVWLMGYDIPMEIDKNYEEAEISKDTAVVLVYGTIPAGVPLECIEDIIGTEEIPANWLKGGKEFFGLKIKGNSMSPEYLENDIIILEKVPDCENGDDCVVMINRK